ncbi:MAG: transporter substrate-binding protein [Subtercola sp.]|nr:transporter substrate-binding protein [Subtercola sp.]
MKRRTRLTYSLAALATTALVITGCSSGSPSPTPSGTNVVLPAGVTQNITIGGFSLNTLDPGAATGFNGPGEAIVQNVFGELVDPPATPGGDYVPDLATAWKYNADFTQLTLTLRPNVTFTDGTPFDAAAVKFNYDRYTTTTSRVSQYVGVIASTVVVDPTTVQINFTTPDTNFLDVLALTVGGSIQSPTAIQKGADKYGLNIVGAGPFMQSAYTPGTQLDLVPNPNYWDAKSTHLQKVTYLNTGVDPSVNYQQVASGAIQVYQVNGVNSSPSVLTDAKGNSGISVVTTDDNQYLFLPLNITTAPFNNPAARQALDYCMDRPTLAKAVTQNFGNPAWIDGGSSTLYYPGGGYSSYPSKFPYPFDTSKGTALVSQLGGLSFDLYNMGGQYTVVANALAQMWKANCGINATVQTDTPPALATRITSGSYSAVLTISGGLDDPSFFRTFQTNTPQGKYTGGVGHPEITGPISEATQTNDPAKLASLWEEVWKQVNTQGFTIPVLSGPIYYLQNTCLQGSQYFGSGATYRYAYLSC